MKKFRVIDADGHCVENDSQIVEYAEYGGRSMKGAAGGPLSIWPSLDGWFRPASDRLSAGEPEAWQSFLEDTEMEMTFLYPTAEIGRASCRERV